MRKRSRRRFLRSGLALAGLGLLAGCAQLPFQAQQPARVPRTGVLSPNPGPTPTIVAFQEGLRDLGYVEGQNLLIEWRYGEGKDERLPDLAAELVRLNVELIVATTGAAAQAAKEASATIPIVVAATGDFIGPGFAASLAHPGGNVTGLSNLALPLVGKRLELIKEAVAGLSQLAVIWNPREQAMALEIGEAKVAARTLGVELQTLEVRDANDFDGAFEAALGGGVEALVLVLTPFFGLNRTRVVELAAKSRLPAISGDPEFARAGGLMAYGPSLPDLFRRAATYVDKILKGANPAELPIEQPTKFDFVINLRTARVLGLTMPQEVLMQATEVIQ